jgi:hypothetical protein
MTRPKQGLQVVVTSGSGFWLGSRSRFIVDSLGFKLGSRFSSGFWFRFWSGFAFSEQKPQVKSALGHAVTIWGHLKELEPCDTSPTYLHTYELSPQSSRKLKKLPSSADTLITWVGCF